MPEHNFGRDTTKAFDFLMEALAVVHVARVSGLMDQDGKRLSPQWLLPEAVAFKRERQLVVTAPMGAETANRHVQIAWIVAKRECARDGLFSAAGGIDELLAKPDRKGKATVNPAFAAVLLDPGMTPVRAVLDLGGGKAARRHLGSDTRFLFIHRLLGGRQMRFGHLAEAPRHLGRLDDVRSDARGIVVEISFAHGGHRAHGILAEGLGDNLLLNLRRGVTLKKPLNSLKSACRATPVTGHSFTTFEGSVIFCCQKATNCSPMKGQVTGALRSPAFAGGVSLSSEK